MCLICGRSVRRSPALCARAEESGCLPCKNVEGRFVRTTCGGVCLERFWGRERDREREREREVQGEEGEEGFGDGEGMWRGD